LFSKGIKRSEPFSNLPSIKGEGLADKSLFLSLALVDGKMKICVGYGVKANRKRLFINENLKDKKY